MDLEEEGAPIAVTLIKPASINTPFTEHARNYMEEEPEYAGSVYPPEEVARAILRCAEHPVRDVTVGGGGKVMTVMGTIAPRLTDLVMERTLYRGQRKNERDDTPDSLHTPSVDVRRHGRTERHVMRSSAYTRAMLSDAGRVLPMIVAGAMLVAGLRARIKPGV
jgi:hypothetical protein